MKTFENDTIAAIITPAGTGGIAVIRLSGPEAIRIADGVFRGASPLADAPSHTVHFGRVGSWAESARDDVELDEVLVTLFRSPRSYTAEDVVEISCHGSTFIASRILSLLVERGARPAGNGEFTRRAFLNGRIDLTQAEGVADLISADSKASHQLALRQVRGMVSGRVSVIRQRIVNLCSTLELELDFSEEGLEFIQRESLRNEVRSISAEIRYLIDSYEHGKIVKEGPRVVLTGAPNVGKSSILNRLLRENRAIVTEISGTTRDTIEEVVSINGIRFTVVDTAGLRESYDPIEVEGIRRTYEELDAADIILVITDPTEPITCKAARAFIDGELGDRVLDGIIVVANKKDISSAAQSAQVQSLFHDQVILSISAKDGTGLEGLEEKIVSCIRMRQSPDGEGVALGSIRQRRDMTEALGALERVLLGNDTGATADLLAVDLRDALSHLSQVVGGDISDEVLNNVFSRFCIGK